MEKPFTGRYIDYDGVGSYHCACCTAPLFLSEHKYTTQSGYASFWTTCDGAIDFDKEAKARLRYENVIDFKFNTGDQQYYNFNCRACQSFIGVVFKDGPAPFFTRFSANSAAILFKDKPYFVDPQYLKKSSEKLRKEKKEAQKIRFSNRQTIDEEQFKDLSKVNDK